MYVTDGGSEGRDGFDIPESRFAVLHYCAMQSRDKNDKIGYSTHEVFQIHS